MYLHVNLKVMATFQSGHALGVPPLFTWAEGTQRLPKHSQVPGFPWWAFPEAAGLEGKGPQEFLKSFNGLATGKGWKEELPATFHVIGKPVMHSFLAQLIVRKYVKPIMEIHKKRNCGWGSWMLVGVPRAHKDALRARPSEETLVIRTWVRGIPMRRRSNHHCL